MLGWLVAGDHGSPPASPSSSTPRDGDRSADLADGSLGLKADGTLGSRAEGPVDHETPGRQTPGENGVRFLGRVVLDSTGDPVSDLTVTISAAENVQESIGSGESGLEFITYALAPGSSTFRPVAIDGEVYECAGAEWTMPVPRAALAVVEVRAAGLSAPILEGRFIPPGTTDHEVRVGSPRTGLLRVVDDHAGSLVPSVTVGWRHARPIGRPVRFISSGPRPELGQGVSDRRRADGRARKQAARMPASFEPLAELVDGEQRVGLVGYDREFWIHAPGYAEERVLWPAGASEVEARLDPVSTLTLELTGEGQGDSTFDVRLLRRAELVERWARASVGELLESRYVGAGEYRLVVKRGSPAGDPCVVDRTIRVDPRQPRHVAVSVPESALEPPGAARVVIAGLDALRARSEELRLVVAAIDPPTVPMAGAWRRSLANLAVTDQGRAAEIAELPGGSYVAGIFPLGAGKRFEVRPGEVADVTLEFAEIALLSVWIDESARTEAEEEPLGIDGVELLWRSALADGDPATRLALGDGEVSRAFREGDHFEIACLPGAVHLIATEIGGPWSAYAQVDVRPGPNSADLLLRPGALPSVEFRIEGGPVSDVGRLRDALLSGKVLWTEGMEPAPVLLARSRSINDRSGWVGESVRLFLAAGGRYSCRWPDPPLGRIESFPPTIELGDGLQEVTITLPP